MDPLAEKYPAYTPYHYVHNNPVNMIDPTGMSLGESIPDSKVTIDNTSHVYEKYTLSNGSQGVRIKSTTEQDTTIYMKDLPKTRFNIYKREVKKINKERNR